MSKQQINGKDNNNNVLAGRDFISLKINSLDYKPCPVCQRSWVEKDKNICNSCTEESIKHEKFNYRKKIFNYIRFGMLAWVLGSFIISGVYFYYVYEKSDDLFVKVSKFKDVCLYGFIISAFVISFLYVVFIIYKRFKSK